MPLSVTSPVLDAHATRVASVFAPNRGIIDFRLKHFFAWFDSVLQQGASGSLFAENIVLDHVAAVSPPIANKVCDMHVALARRSWNPVMPQIDQQVKRTFEDIFAMFPDAENQLVVDSMVTLVEYAASDDPPPHTALAKINTAEMLFDKLDPVLVEYVKSRRFQSADEP